MSPHRLPSVIAVLIGASTCAVAEGEFTLISQSRSVITSASAYDGLEKDGDAMQEYAPDFGPFDATAQVSVALLGATAAGTAEQDSIVQADILSVAHTTQASLSSPGGIEWVNASITSAYSAVFEVNETTDVLVQGTTSTNFISPSMYGQTFIQIWRQIPCPLPCDVDEDCPLSDCGGDPNPGDGNAEGFCIFDNCQIWSNPTCGSILTLEPGRYEFVVTATSQVSEGNGAAVSGAVHADIVASLRPADLAVGEVAFQVDTNRSGMNLTVQFPGGQPQNFSLSLEGVMSLLMTFSCDFDTAQLTGLDLAVPEQVDLVPPPGFAPGGPISVTGIGVNMTDPGGPAALTNGNGLLENVGFQIVGSVGGAEQSGLPLAVMIYNCILEMLCGLPDGCTCFADPSMPCVEFVQGGSLTLTLPGINLVTPIDLGLGTGNPIAQITGTIVANAVTPNACPWDCADGDGNVGITDFLALLAQWGEAATACDLGLGGPGVGIEEFLDQLANWGPCP